MPHSVFEPTSDSPFPTDLSIEVGSLPMPLTPPRSASAKVVRRTVVVSGSAAADSARISPTRDRRYETAVTSVERLAARLAGGLHLAPLRSTSAKVVRRTVVVSGSAAADSARISPTRDRRYGTAVTSVERLAARLAGGLGSVHGGGVDLESGRRAELRT